MPRCLPAPRFYYRARASPCYTPRVINAVGQYWWTRALSLAPPSAVGPFYYFMLVWSAALGFVFWGDVPTLALIVGSAVVVGSGLFLLWHETSKKSLAAD
ncbi:MAG: DMT family transporter [Pseudolabrys sp.]